MDNGKFRRLTEDFWVAPQLEKEDFARIAALGIRTVINNRPDGEAIDQLPAAAAAEAARAAGLTYLSVPVRSGGLFPDQIAAMAEAIASSEGPWLAYCRSGTRSCHLWAFLAARKRPPAEIVEAAARAGYDLRSLWATLEAVHTVGREAEPAPA